MNRSEERVLVFCHSYYGPFADVVRQYSALFKGTHYKVTSVYLTGEPSESVIGASDSDEVIFMNLNSKEVYGLKLQAILRLRRILVSRNIKYIIAHRFKPIYVSLIATRVPVIGVHHAFGDYERWSHRCFINRFKHRLTLVGISNAIRDDIRKNLLDWPKDRLITLHNRINVSRSCSELLSRDIARSVLGLKSDAFVIANVGRLHPDKDQSTLIHGFSKALPELPKNAILIIIGQGRLENDLKQLANRLGLTTRIYFLGQVPNVHRLFPAFDLFVLSSDHEPFGMVLLEAFVARVPVLVSDCGGAPEVVNDPEASFTFGDVGSLSRRLIEWSKKSTAETDYITDHNYNELTRRFSDEIAQWNFFNFPQIKNFHQNRSSL